MGGTWEPLCRRLGVHHPTLAAVFIQFGSAGVNTAFHFYYVKVFLTHYKISPAWFQASQLLFMVWNSINDPLFGIMQDLGGGWTRSRKKAILYSGPFYAASFLVFWFPWGDENSPPWVVGLHLLVALFLYDGVFSFALLAWCALFAEISTEHTSRVRALKYSQTALLCGVNVIIFLEKISNSLQDFQSFQMGCVGLASLAWYCCYYTGTYASAEIAQVTRLDSSAELGKASASVKAPLVEQRSSAETEKEEKEMSSWGDAYRISRQILSAKDFRSVTAANFLHTCRSTAHLNFAAIFTEGLIPRDVLPLGSWHISVFYGVCTLMPQVLFITLSSLINKHGSYKILMVSFYATVVSGLAAWLFLGSFPRLILVFMLVDSITVHAFSPLFNLLFVDFIDDDMERHRRKAPMSSLVFSLNALFTKPAQSLAPMAVVAALNLRHYKDYTDKRLVEGSVELNQLQSLMFGLLTLLPAGLGLLQALLFRRYSLRTTHHGADELEPQQGLL